VSDVDPACTARRGADDQAMTVRTYRLIVEGELSDSMEVAFDDVTLMREGGNTTLTHLVRDQAELQGLIQRVSDLGLTLLEVTVADGVTQA
jgi:hypothetical protein